MTELTSKERILRTLRREPVDRIGSCESFWAETSAKWTSEGHLAEGENINDHFAFDFRDKGWWNMTGNIDGEDEVLEEDEETRLVRNVDGAVMRWWKNKAGTPDHIDFAVKDRAAWEANVRPHLVDPDNYRKRIDVEAFAAARQAANDEEKFFHWTGVNVFECMHPICGHENMLIGMALDPDWIRDMCSVYAEMIINLMEIVFDEGGLPDGVYFYEDMGFKNKPFMSPAMYKEIIWPSHKRLFDFCHSKGLPIILHSCGYVEQFIPGLIEAGLDCLQALEVKAGMDLVHLKKTYGEHLAFFGGMDVRPMVANDLDAIQAELDLKLPAAMEGGGYILHSDHSIPSQVEYETYKFFLERGLEMGTYK